MSSRSKPSVRAFARQLHLWLGLSIGALFVVVGLTGSILVFYTAIDDALHPAIRLQGAAPPPSWERVYQTARATYPDKAGPWRFEVTGAGGDIPARYYNPPERADRDFAPMMVWFSADGGQVLRRDYWGEYAMTWVYDLHHRLLLQATGGAILGWSGLAMLSLMAAGLTAWWPRKGGWRKALRIKPGAAPVRRLYDWHKQTGLWSFGLLALLTLTGVLLALPKESEAVLTPVLGPPAIAPTIDKSAPFDPAARISVDRAVAIAQAALPGARIAWIETPTVDRGVYRLRLQAPGDPSRRFPHSFVWVEPASGEVLGVTDARRAGAHDILLNWIHPLHDASIGGLPARLLAIVVGLAPAVLFGLGVMRWRRRMRPLGPEVSGRR
ncbi:PepSY domain-containing protein [Caulobacter sp. SL161]|uniref:PepSY-associated TM helix domain-containing protein n=1 Tax=Caulobacter sp. SL161 TaxID=2995156 RepID=UPI002274E984|nr:PepSY domain-containing protein [Caulobacter sp. SL161]MCY1646629.1 PepSY domain-containing protein [Caulobacter sp. SL161]